MNSNHPKTKQQRSSPLICAICGDLARGLNFSVLSCMSCKMFFRRHAQTTLLRQRCRFDGECCITRRTRKFCLPCRLKRCFQAGMDVQLIRHSHERKDLTALPKPRCRNLLDHDRSTLTMDEWNLLSNIVNIYDEQNLIEQTNIFFKHQFSLPPKIRSKDSNTLNHIARLYSRIHLFIEGCPLFCSLSADLRQALLKRNLNAIGGFNAFFLAKEMHVFEDETYSELIDNIYGYGYSKSVVQASRRLTDNGTLVKITLMIMVFLSNCSVVTINYSENIQISFDSKSLLCIQDILVTMLWKYLIYQYGFKGATSRLLSLIKSILDMILRMEGNLNIQKHWTMFGNVLDKIIYPSNSKSI